MISKNQEAHLDIVEGEVEKEAGTVEGEVEKEADMVKGEAEKEETGFGDGVIQKKMAEDDFDNKFVIVHYENNLYPGTVIREEMHK